MSRKEAPDELIMHLLECKNKAMKLNRFKTMRAIDESLKVAGYELANQLIKKQS